MLEVKLNHEKALLFKALSDENRLSILELLLKGETCGCTLIDKLPVTQPTMSYHLDVLTESGIIQSVKEGKWKKHHVNRDKIDELIRYLTTLKNLKGSCERG
jgi:ArsR family transcriptional regulator